MQLLHKRRIPHSMHIRAKSPLAMFRTIIPSTTPLTRSENVGFAQYLRKSVYTGDYDTVTLLAWGSGGKPVPSTFLRYGTTPMLPSPSCKTYTEWKAAILTMPNFALRPPMVSFPMIKVGCEFSNTATVSTVRSTSENAIPVCREYPGTTFSPVLCRSTKKTWGVT